MGMCGCFFRTSEENINSIISGELSSTDLVYNDDNEEFTLDIDKSWHAIQFTLTGDVEGGSSDNILDKLMCSDNPIDDEDLGYGPAMLITSSEVKELALELNKISQEEFRSKISIKDMVANDVYCVSDDETEDETFEYIGPYFEDIKVFFKEASSENQAVLFYIC